MTDSEHKRDRRWAIAGALGGTAFASALLGAGAAYAILGGTVSGTTAAIGIAANSGSACQTTAINWAWGDASWSSSAATYQVSQITASNVAAGCSGDELTMTITNSSDVIVDEQSWTISSTSHTFTLSPVQDVANLSGYTVNYIVQ